MGGGEDARFIFAGSDGEELAPRLQPDFLSQMSRGENASLICTGSVGEELEPTLQLKISSRRRAIALSAAAAVLVGAATVLTTNLNTTQMAIVPKPDVPFTLYFGVLPMPQQSPQYDGIEDNRYVNITPNKWGEVRVFAIGDWGAPLKTNHQTFAAESGEESAQFWVAGQMKSRAAWAQPQYVLNVGDNFYVDGVDGDCNQGPGAAWGAAKHEFEAGWGWIYGELSQKPWISALGNHDYGGWQMNRGWPLQVGYSFINHNWILPARYYSKTMWHGDYAVHYFIIDSNAWDAMTPNDPNVNQDHNICSLQHNPWGASCGGNAGPANVWNCKDWFWGSFTQQKKWLTEKVAASKALWKVVITHFPCGYDAAFYRGLNEKHGVNLLVTGHRHQQELWYKGTTAGYIKDFLHKNNLGDLTCFVTGGGGGIRSEKFGAPDYGNGISWYGFFDLTISKWYIKVELVNSDGSVMGNVTIHATPSQTNQINAAKAKQNKRKGNKEKKHKAHENKSETKSESSPKDSGNVTSSNIGKNTSSTKLGNETFFSKKTETHEFVQNFGGEVLASD